MPFSYDDPVSLAGMIGLQRNIPFADALLAASVQTRQNDTANLEKQKFQQAQMEKQKLLEQQQKLQALLPQIASQLDLNDIQGSFQKLSQIMPAGDAARVLSQLAKARPQDEKLTESILPNPVTGETFLTAKQNGSFTDIKPVDLNNFNRQFTGQLTKEDLGTSNTFTPRTTPLEEKFPLIGNYITPSTTPETPKIKMLKAKNIEETRKEINTKARGAADALKNIERTKPYLKRFRTGALAGPRIAAGKVGNFVFNNDFGVDPAAGELIDKEAKRMAGILTREMEGGNNRISDKALEWALAQVAGSNMEPETASTILDIFAKSFQVMEQQPKAFGFYTATFGTDDGFQSAWNDYLKALGAKGITFDAKKPTFKDFLQGKMDKTTLDLSDVSTEELQRIQKGL